jgi:hypothetical protein
MYGAVAGGGSAGSGDVTAEGSGEAGDSVDMGAK